MIRYLLGQLSDPEQAEVEACYLADDDCFAELLALEDELRDAYARGELSAGDRVAFEHRLLASPQQVGKQEFARTLRQYVMEPPLTAAHRTGAGGKWKSWFRLVSARPRTVLIPVLSTSLVLLVAVVWWLSYQGRRQLATASSAHRAAAPGEAPGQAPAQRQTSGGTSTIAFVLNPGIVRGPEQAPPPLALSPGVSRIRLKARLEADSPSYDSYRALLETVDNQHIWSAGKLKAETPPSGKTVSIDLPSSLLQPGDYILTLRGVSSSGSLETVAEYSFRIAKRQADHKP